jgi:hypothetical protein
MNTHQNNTFFTKNGIDINSCNDYGLNSVLIYNNYKSDKMDQVVGEIVTGNATSTYNPNRYVSMHVFDIGDRVVRQTLDYFSSNSYKIKKCIFKVCMNTLKDSTGYRSRVGVFDDHDDKISLPDPGTGVTNSGGAGLFFQLENNIFSIGIRYGVSNNGNDIIINQDEWNVNKLNKDSHLQFRRWDKVQSFEISYNTIGLIEWSIFIDGIRVVLHRYSKVNHDLHIIHRFDLPIRYEIEKISNVSNSAEMRQFEESIGIEQDGSIVNITNNSTTTGATLGFCKQLSAFSNKVYTINTSGDYIPLFSVRLKAEFNRNPISDYEIDGVSTDNCPPFQIALIKNPTFIGAQPNWMDTTHTIQYDNTTTTIDQTNIDIIKEFYVLPNLPFPRSGLNGRSISISSNIGGTPDIFTVVARKINATGRVTSYFNFRWLED